jgi:aerobic-type carbon monoxide dehydrogenase small subunit (CoxS/CutS family)
MAHHTFILNGKRVSVDVEDDVRLLWVLRDILGVTGPKYGCGIGVCQACTSHVNGKAVNICSIPITDADLDGLRNVCRCGTYPRIREAIRDGEKGMRAKRKRKPAGKA